jgi:sodium transport system permease protein
MIPQQVLNASLVGLVLGLLAVRTRSLLPPIVFHMTFNALIVCHGRFSAQIPTDGVWSWFFQRGETVQYQPMLLVIGALVATGLLTLLIRRPSQASPLRSTIPTSIPTLAASRLVPSDLRRPRSLS